MASEINAEEISSSITDPLSVPSAEEFKSNAITVVEDAVEDDEFRLQRSEILGRVRGDTLDLYHRHVFLVYKNVEKWKETIKKCHADVEKDSLPGCLAAALKSNADKTSIKTHMTLCEGPSGTYSSDGDVFVFPEMVKYRGLTNDDVDKFVEDVLVNGKDWVSGLVEQLEGSYVFVCAHAPRHMRCGVCGPQLFEKLKEEIEKREGTKNRVFVAPCSHIGGHKYGGVMIMFTRSSTGDVTGQLYGNATLEDLPSMLQEDVTEVQWRYVNASLEDILAMLQLYRPTEMGGVNQRGQKLAVPIEVVNPNLKVIADLEASIVQMAREKADVILSLPNKDWIDKNDASYVKRVLCFLVTLRCILKQNGFKSHMVSTNLKEKAEKDLKKPSISAAAYQQQIEN
ncbi:hypothetical protein MKW94_001195, partial [Papaver nudicaule]|nr:hypothetical protein [Papaver nudicaule]